ncbi:MAG: hypothetical protein ACRCY8_15630 [Dermatophilaceae bacterium]
MTTTSATADLADRVAEAVLAVPGVAGLHGGAFGEVATYLPARRVTGIRLNDDQAGIHVTVGYGAPVHDVAARIRAAVAPLVAVPVTVRIEDVVPVPPTGTTP